MRDRINADLKEAMKAQDKRRVSTLRLISAAIKDRDLGVRGGDGAGTPGRISDAEILDLLTKMIKQRRDAIVLYEEAGRVELAQQEQEEIAIIEEFLPRQLDEAETRAAVTDVVREIGSSTLKDMGRTMAALKERFSGRMDFAKASGVVKELLK